MSTFVRIVIILLAAVLVTGLTLTLAQTEWADGMRVEDSGEVEGDGARDMAPALLAVVSFVKTLVFMGIPFGLTLLVLRFAKHPAGGATS